MFDKQYKFTGSHGYKVTLLLGKIDDVSGVKLFNRLVDILIVAPLIGFLYQRTSEKNYTKVQGVNYEKSIMEHEMSVNSETFSFICRLILLLDGNELDKQNRIDRAFKFFDSEQNMIVFNNYALGGVDILYEKLIDSNRGIIDCLNRLYAFMEEVQEHFNKHISIDNILELCD